MTKWIYAAVLATLVGVLAVPAQAGRGHGDGNEGPAPSAAPLTGESLLASEIGNPGTSTVTGSCDPLGTSSLTFTVTGNATGPYPGTFSETGTVTLGPFGIPGNPLAALAFQSDFTITSLAGTVTGTKTLEGFQPTSLGLCGVAAFPTGGANSLHFEGTVSYTASITTPNGTGTDSGESFVNLQDTQIRDLVGFNGFAFAENYTSMVAVDCNDHHRRHGGDDDCDDDDDDDD